MVIRKDKSIIFIMKMMTPPASGIKMTIVHNQYMYIDRIDNNRTIVMKDTHVYTRLNVSTRLSLQTIG